MIKANYFRSSIRRHSTSNRKFSHSNRFIPQKNLPACTTNAVLRKYGGTSARCTSFGPYFNNGNQNPFILNLPRPKITTANAWQPGLLKPWDLLGTSRFLVFACCAMGNNILPCIYHVCYNKKCISNNLWCLYIIFQIILLYNDHISN
jgi:hypothetical protein